MSATEITKAFQEVGTFTNSYNFPYAEKSFSSIKKIVEISSDEKSVEKSKKVIAILKNIKSKLPIAKDDFKLDVAQQQVKINNTNLQYVSSFLEAIDNVFDDCECTEIVIDDKNAVALIENAKQAKAYMEYISNYYQLAIDIHITKTKEHALYSYEELVTS